MKTFLKTSTHMLMMTSLAVFQEMDHTLIYTALVVAIIASSLHRRGYATIQRLNYSKEIWSLICKVTSRELIIQGLKWGVPIKLLHQVVAFHRHFARKLRRPGALSSIKKKHRSISPKNSIKKKRKLNRTVTLYRKMPLKSMSRLWGQINELNLPVFLRKPVIGLYIWMFGCKIDEAVEEDLKSYRNLSEFFRRQLKPHVRPVDLDHHITSPADGKVLHYGKVESGVLEQVKGITYSLKGFLGSNCTLSDDDFQKKLLKNPANELYHCVIYLSPGDYHRFHSPALWKMNYRRHFPGELLSVSPGVARWVQGLFNFNERVVYTGEWEHGFFSMTAVGATNVGSIKIYCDNDLTTNSSLKYPEGSFYDKEFKQAIEVQKGEMFGEFNLGSTIVLVFEGPKDFEFKVDNNQRVQFGEPMGRVLTSSDTV